MLRSTLLIFSIIFILLLFPGCRNNGDSILVTTGETFRIELDSNWSTGYRWFLMNGADSGILEMVDSFYTSDQIDDSISGAPGIEIFEFKGISPGRESLVFHYKRPWEESSRVDKQRITIIVEDKSRD